MMRYEQSLITEDGIFQVYIQDDITHVHISFPKEVLIKAITENRPIKFSCLKDVFRHGKGECECILMFKPSDWK